MAARAKKKKKNKHGGGSDWISDPRLCCLGDRCRKDGQEARLTDVHDVDYLPEGETIPYRTRLCAKCREGLNITHDRGDVNAGKEKPIGRADSN